MNEDIIAAGVDLLARLEVYGYNQLLGAEIQITVPYGNCIFRVIADDNFQVGADYTDKIQSGYLTFYFEDGRFVIPEDFKTREQRELHFMTRRFGKSKELADQMVSAAGRAFALKMEQELSTLRTMITGPLE